MCSEKIKKILNNDPDLIEKFGKSLELDKKSYFKVKTDKNKIIKLSPEVYWFSVKWTKPLLS